MRHIRNAGIRSSVVAPVRTGRLLLNVMLMVVALAALSYYIVQANRIAALRYDIDALEEDVIALREEHHAIGAAIADQEHPDRIAQFAQEAGMVLASDAAFVSVPEPPLAGR